MIAGDAKPSECTGIRIGTAAITTRGFDEEMCYELGRIITKILTNPNCDEKSKEGIIDLEPISIKVKLSKMLDRIGSFYKSSLVNTYTDTDSDTPDDLA
jgi:glycine/serine hydroxymethyltransferase